MHVTQFEWIITLGVTIAVLLFDVIVIGRRPHEPSKRETATYLTIYVGLAVVFGLWVWLFHGSQFGLEFFAGWLTEYSLSVDNLFIFLIIMASFKVPKIYQQQALLVGIILALIFRGIFIALGAVAIDQFSWVFYIFGSIGVVLSLIWFWYYRNRPQEHPDVNERELGMIGPAASQGVKKVALVPWRQIVRSRDLWFLSGMYFCYGWVVWMYLFWFPTYLVEARHFSQIKMGLGASLPLLAATVTNVAGGWISDKLTCRWSDLRRGRLAVSVIGFGIAAVGLIPGVLVKDALTGLLCLTFALAGLELTVAVSWAISLDIGGDYSGSVSGVMNTLGNLGGALSSVVIGYLATKMGWNWPFLVGSAMCLVAALLATRINPNRSAVTA